MKHRFKSKRSIKRGLLKTIIIIIMVIISFVLTFKWLFSKLPFSLNNEKYMNYLVHDSFGSYSIYDIANLSSIDFLLKYSLGIEKKDPTNTPSVKEELTSPPPLEIESPSPVKKDPLIYIFNTHQTEGYKNTFLETFNINNTVLFASYILKEYLADLGLASVVEENSIVDVLNANGWKYGSSYKASRIFLEQAQKDYPSLNYYIDLHRDSSSYGVTSTEIDGVKYAKVLFVVGLEHESYEKNLQFANRLNDLIKDVDSSLSRGIMEKKGKGVNGKYNQDFSPHTVLIEVGGQYNSIEEVNNTLKVLAKVLFLYISEAENEKK